MALRHEADAVHPVQFLLCGLASRRGGAALGCISLARRKRESQSHLERDSFAILRGIPHVQGRVHV